MLTSPKVLELKSSDFTNLALGSMRAKSSLSKISLKSTMSGSHSKEKNKDKTKSLKNLSGLGMEINQITKSNRNLEENILGAMTSIKKIKTVSKNLKKKDGEVEFLNKDLIKSNQELDQLKNKLAWYEDLFNELYHHSKANDDESISQVYLSSKSKNLKMKIPRNSLSIEELILRPETARQSIKSVRNYNTKSPYVSNTKMFLFSRKSSKHEYKIKKRGQASTPTEILFKKTPHSNVEIDTKLKKIFTRMERLLRNKNNKEASTIFL